MTVSQREIHSGSICGEHCSDFAGTMCDTALLNREQEQPSGRCKLTRPDNRRDFLNTCAIT